MDHFEGKSAFEHLKEARLRTKRQLKEDHAVETKSPWDAGIRLMSETAMFGGMLLIYSHFFLLTLPSFLIFLIAFTAFRAVYSALDSYARLNRLHRIIEEERYEIEHNLAQERLELEALYRQKGFEGQLLNDVIEVLMSDRNRLLGVMLEEELGLQVEGFDHPLLQGLGALVGGVVAVIPLTIAFIFLPWTLSLLAPVLVAAIAAGIKAHLERLSSMKLIVWHGASLGLILSLFYWTLSSYRH